MFAAKLSPDGSAYQEFTFLGGDGIDRCAGVQLDVSGNVYVAGQCNATWGSPIRAFSGTQDAFAAKERQRLRK